jgi:beta-lactam-binding protein with PASTA domain
MRWIGLRFTRIEQIVHMRTGRGAGAPRDLGNGGGYPYRGDEAETLALPEYEAPTVPRPGPPPVPPPDDRQPWTWLLAFLVLALAGAGGAYALSRGGGQHRVRPQQTVVVTRAAVPASTASKAKPILPMKAVPNVLGLPVTKAVVLIQKPGFVAQKTLVASKKPNGTVVSQQPAPRSKLARGGAVLLAVSRGPGLAVLPSLVGQTEQAAIAALTSLGLEANAVRVPSPQTTGTVVAQNPKAGEKVLKGSKVRLNIASGAPTATATPTGTATRKAAAPAPAAVKVTVPDVEGLKLSAARTTLQADGLIIELRYVPSQLPASTVTGQSPKAGTSVKTGSHVFLTVSRGRSQPQRPQQQLQQQQQQTVPNVVG